MNINNNIMPSVKGLKTLTKCSSHPAVMAIQDFSIPFHYDRRATNKVAIPNKSGFSLCKLLSLLSPFLKATTQKVIKVKPNINHRALDSLTLVDILDSTLNRIDTLAMLLADANCEINSGQISGLLSAIIDATYQYASAEGGLNYE